MSQEFLTIIIKMCAGGIIAFLAILLMSKTRDTSWMFIVSGFLFSYIATVYDLFIELGVLVDIGILIFGIPLISFLCMVIPSICFIIGLIIKISGK